MIRKKCGMLMRLFLWLVNGGEFGIPSSWKTTSSVGLGWFLEGQQAPLPQCFVVSGKIFSLGQPQNSVSVVNDNYAVLLGHTSKKQLNTTKNSEHAVHQWYNQQWCDQQRFDSNKFSPRRFLGVSNVEPPWITKTGSHHDDESPETRRKAILKLEIVPISIGKASPKTQ